MLGEYWLTSELVPTEQVSVNNLSLFPTKDRITEIENQKAQDATYWNDRTPRRDPQKCCLF